MKVLITGAAGMVGKALARHCATTGDIVSAYDHAGLDISDSSQVNEATQSIKPDAIFNCAAWTDVDACESDPERAFAANAIGPENLARAASDVNAAFITISTDYVFDGAKDGFYTQADQPNPQSVYAKSKLAGEQRALNAYANSIIVRTGYIFGAEGKNFLSRVLDFAREHKQITAIHDAYGTPTYAPDLAVTLRELAGKDAPNIYHIVNSGDGATFEQFACEAVRLVHGDASKIQSVSMESLKRPAKRPRNSRLKCLYSAGIGLAPLRSWQDALAEFAGS